MRQLVRCSLWKLRKIQSYSVTTTMSDIVVSEEGKTYRGLTVSTIKPKTITIDRTSSRQQVSSHTHIKQSY